MHVCYVSTIPYIQDICQMYFLSEVQYADTSEDAKSIQDLFQIN